MKPATLWTLVLLLFGTSSASVRSQDLPTREGPENLEAEAQKLMEDLPNLEAELAQESTPSGELPDVAVTRTQKLLDRARQKQQRWEKLARQGVLSRAEAEGCVVEVADALARHERARVGQLRAQLSLLQQRATKGEADASLVETAESGLQAALLTAAAAEKQARKVRLDAAKTHLDRSRRLFASGLVSRVQLQRAEANLRKLEADSVAPPAAE